MRHTVLQKKLKNGISLVVVPLSHTEAVTVTVLFGVGSRYESDAQRGLAHFTEHMVFKGGKAFPTPESISQAMDAVGGEFNAFTSQEYTGFYTKTASRHMRLGVELLADMLLHARIPENELEKEKGVIVEEINMYEDMPMRKVDLVLADLAFGDTPLGRPIAGTKKTVTAFTRQDFLRYREQFYMGTQCTIAIAGAASPEEAESLVERFFGAMPEGEPFYPAPGALRPADQRVRIERRDSEQTHLMLATSGYPLKHPRRYAYRVLGTILGGNMSSRLFVSVREKQGLCYYVRTHPDIYADCGLMVSSAGVDNARLPQVVAAIMAELRMIRAQPVSEDELERAKQYLLGRTMLYLEDSEQVAEFYGMQDLMEKEIEGLDEIEKGILAVSAEDVLAVARELLSEESLRLAVIGPHDDSQALEKLLTFTE